VKAETMSYSGGTALPGIEYQSLPTARSFGLNLNVKL
jgi:hypothetical protein